MSRTFLPNDATIETVENSLSEREDYMIGVFHNLRYAEKEHGSKLFVRIGVQGGGAYPNYRIELEDESVIVSAHRGRTHDDLVEDKADLQQNTWSTARINQTTFIECFKRMREWQRSDR